MAHFSIKQNDTRPKLAVELDADPTDIISDVQFYMATKDGTLVIDGEDGIVEEQPSATSGGIISYQWQTGDTADEGTYLAEFRVTFADGKIETWLNTGYIEIRIYESLGGTWVT